MKFCTLTLGCKVNQFETQAIENILISNGHTLVKVGAGCDVCIINTCTVTAISAGKSRKAIRQLKKLEPEALIAVSGCLSQLEPDEIELIGVDILSGSGDRLKFVELIEQCYNANNRLSQDKATLISGEALISSEVGELIKQPVFEELPVGSQNKKSSRTRALLKIQDGCNNYCAYCVIPYARGHSRSLLPSIIGEQAKQLSQQGFREIVITGIEISSYGKDIPDTPSLIDVLKIVSEAAPDVRIRLGSLDPSIITDKLCTELLGIINLCDHFHLSVQSGCDETLLRMGRKYTTDGVLHAITKLRKQFPNCGITADLMVGFPGETDVEFEETQQFIKQAAFSDMHVFPFSPRPGTRAAKMPNQISNSIKKNRAKIISTLAAEMSNNFKMSQVGKTLEVLFERKRDGYWVGYTTNYIEVAIKSDAENLRNCIKPIEIT